MRQIKLDARDMSLFSRDLDEENICFYMLHAEDFRRMHVEQGKDFWICFVHKFRWNIMNVGICSEQGADRDTAISLFSRVFSHIDETFVDGTTSDAYNLVIDIVLINHESLLVRFQDAFFPCSVPRDANVKRNAFRRLFGEPEDVLTHLRAGCTLPIFSKFGGSVAQCLRRWLQAPPSSEGLRHAPSSPNPTRATLSEKIPKRGPEHSSRKPWNAPSAPNHERSYQRWSEHQDPKLSRPPMANSREESPPDWSEYCTPRPSNPSMSASSEGSSRNRSEPDTEKPWDFRLMDYSGPDSASEQNASKPSNPSMTTQHEGSRHSWFHGLEDTKSPSDFDRVIDFDHKLLMEEKRRGNPFKPSCYSWVCGDPRFADPSNPLYDPSADPQSDWREDLTFSSFQRFRQYILAQDVMNSIEKYLYYSPNLLVYPPPPHRRIYDEVERGFLERCEEYYKRGLSVPTTPWHVDSMHPMRAFFILMIDRNEDVVLLEHEPQAFPLPNIFPNLKSGDVLVVLRISLRIDASPLDGLEDIYVQRKVGTKCKKKVWHQFIHNAVTRYLEVLKKNKMAALKKEKEANKMENLFAALFRGSEEVNLPERHTCAGCGALEPGRRVFKICGLCRQEKMQHKRFYCSKGCQANDWKLRHRTEHKFKFLEKEAAGPWYE